MGVYTCTQFWWAAGEPSLVKVFRHRWMQLIGILCIVKNREVPYEVVGVTGASTRSVYFQDCISY